jgi:hypothetical protein
MEQIEKRVKKLEEWSHPDREEAFKEEMKVVTRRAEETLSIIIEHFKEMEDRMEELEDKLKVLEDGKRN